MAMSAQYINRLEQFGKVAYDLVVDDGGSTVWRSPVEFLKASDTKATRNAFAASVIDRLSQPPEPPPEGIEEVSPGKEEVAVAIDAKLAEIAMDETAIDRGWEEFQKSGKGDREAFAAAFMKALETK